MLSLESAYSTWIKWSKVIVIARAQRVVNLCLTSLELQQQLTQRCWRIVETFGCHEWLDNFNLSLTFNLIKLFVKLLSCVLTYSIADNNKRLSSFFFSFGFCFWLLFVERKIWSVFRKTFLKLFEAFWSSSISASSLQNFYVLKWNLVSVSLFKP